MLKQSPQDYFRKSITVPFRYCTPKEMKTRFTYLHARTALGLQLVPSIIENIAAQLSPPVYRVSGSAPANATNKIKLFHAVGLLKNVENNEHWLNFCRFPLLGTGTNRF